MKPNLLFAAGALALAMSNAHAASWGMVDGRTETGLSQAADLTLGASHDTLAHSANPIPGTLVDAGGLYAYDAGLSPFMLSDGADSFSADFAHEASGSTDAHFDGLTAQLKLNTLIALSATSAAGSMLSGNTALATFASQDFRILPGLGEAEGDRVHVSFEGRFERFADSAGVVGEDFYTFVYRLDLCNADFTVCNPVQAESRVADGVNSFGTGFDATLGSVLRLSGSVSLADAAIGLALGAGDTQALIYGEQVLDLTLAPVPEPSVWMSLLAGIGVVFLMVGRHKRRTL